MWDTECLRNSDHCGEVQDDSERSSGARLSSIRVIGPRSSDRWARSAGEGRQDAVHLVEHGQRAQALSTVSHAPPVCRGAQPSLGFAHVLRVLGKCFRTPRVEDLPGQRGLTLSRARHRRAGPASSSCCPLSAIGRPPGASSIGELFLLVRCLFLCATGDSIGSSWHKLRALCHAWHAL